MSAVLIAWKLGTFQGYIGYTPTGPRAKVVPHGETQAQG